MAIQTEELRTVLTVDGEQPPAPMRVEIVNADQLQAARLMVVKRDDKGKISGAVIQSGSIVIFFISGA